MEQPSSDHTAPFVGGDSQACLGPVAEAAARLGPCSVRFMDSSLDQYPDLLSAFRAAEQMTDRSIISRTAISPIFVTVYDRHGLVATLRRPIHIKGWEK